MVRRRWAPRRRAARRLSAPPRVHAVRRAVRVGGHSAEASAAGIVFTLSAPGHAPRAGRAWPLVVTSTWRGRALPRAGVRVALLQSGRVTARLASARLFHGRYRRPIRWPARSVGQPVTLRVVVSARGRVVTFLYGVTVR